VGDIIDYTITYKNIGKSYMVKATEFEVADKVVVDETVTNASNELLKTATEMLVNQFKISHSTLQIELEGQIPSERCHDCDHR
jgi:hypothetical protein